MTASNKHMMIALTISSMLVLFNIIAVLSGSATSYYNQIEQYIFDALPVFDFL